MALDGTAQTQGLTKGQRTRARLVAAALELIGDEGIGGLTTGRVAARAGLAQSSFYQHFRNLDACLEEAGRHVAERIRPARPQLAERALAAFEGTDDLPALIELLVTEAVLPYLDEPELTMLYQRYQLDPSPFGRAMDACVERERGEVTAIWWEAARRLGLGPELYPVVALQAELTNAMAQGALRAIIRQQFDNRAMVIATLRLMIEGGVRAGIERFERLRAERAAR